MTVTKIIIKQESINQETTKISAFFNFLLHFSIFLLEILNIVSQLSCEAMIKYSSKNIASDVVFPSISAAVSASHQQLYIQITERPAGQARLRRANKTKKSLIIGQTLLKFYYIAFQDYCPWPRYFTQALLLSVLKFHF